MCQQYKINLQNPVFFSDECRHLLCVVRVIGSSSSLVAVAKSKRESVQNKYGLRNLHGLCLDNDDITFHRPFRFSWSIMAVGKNKRLTKGGKKGAKKKM